MTTTTTTSRTGRRKRTHRFPKKNGKTRLNSPRLSSSMMVLSLLLINLLLCSGGGGGTVSAQQEQHRHHHQVNNNSTTTTTTITTVMIVDVRDPHIQEDIPTMIAVQVCVGLFNHNRKVIADGVPAAYTLWEDSDKIWATELLEPDAALRRIPVPVDDFLSNCLSTVAKGRYIHYDYHRQRLVVPNLLTLAAVLHAVPLVKGLQTSLITFPQQLARSGTTTSSTTLRKGNNNKRATATTTPFTDFQQVFDAETTWHRFTAYDATRYMFRRYSRLTSKSGISVMNPGYDNRIDDENPNAKVAEEVDVHGSPLTQPPNLRWADYVVSAHLFNFYLPKGCLRFTMEHALLEEMVNPETSPWNQPIAVYGYNDVKVGPAYFFESETLCVGNHNMGQIATETNNLAFWSTHSPPVTTPLLQPYNRQQQQSTTTPASASSTPTTNKVYDPSKTYVTFVIGDGDNVAFVKNRNYYWVQKRLAYCNNQTLPTSYRCFPISWSISPHLLELAPPLLKWYYQQAFATRNDYFLLPPSGYTYSYPGMMSSEFYDGFVHRTENAAYLLNTTGTVDWEFLLTWRHAIRKFFPRYAASDGPHKIRGLFPVNVPFNIPVLVFYNPNEHYKLIHAKQDDGRDGHPVVLFRPREWRGTSGHSQRVILSKAQNLRPDQMAKEINSYPKGTVSYLYLTSDDRCDLDSLYDMVSQLQLASAGGHVEIVDHETLIDMALQRG